MQQSPTISIEHNSSENSLNKINKLEKWCQLTKRIVQFFRFIKVPILRSRFIDMVSRISIDHIEIEDMNDYETRKIQEDFLFLDDIKRYQEVFRTFTSFGFVWQDKEFRLAKLKANYIYDHYMATSETNIPLDTIPFIYNRINSPKVFSSLTYLNLFNDAEKFIIEKLLMIYMRKGLHCFSVLSEKQTIFILNRPKGNRISDRSISSFEHLNEISDHLNMKVKNISKIEPQYEEIIIPNWTYSTGLGVVYNPIVEKHVKVTRKNAQKKLKDVDSSSMIKLNHDTPNERKRFHSNSPKTVLPTSSKCHFRDSQTIFICKVHSSSWSGSNRFIIKNEATYRIAARPQSRYFDKIQKLCH